MTRKEFNDLSMDDQESFINSGGLVVSDKKEGNEKEVSISCAKDTQSCSEETSLPSFLSSIGSVASPIEDRQTGSVESSVSGPSLPTSVEIPPKESSSAVAPEEVSPSVALSPSTEVAFDIDDPAELLFLFDADISSGAVALHAWQLQFMLDFAAGGVDHTKPFQSVVRACNGSGKDKYIIAACVVWLCMRYPYSTCVVTSASGAQLDRQTCRYIKQLADSVNRKFGQEIWKLNYRYYSCNFGDGALSECFCYATDEPGKAEGYHPVRNGAKMALFASEDKTIPDEINVAMSKCTGYTHRVHVSTPGLPMGHFFDYCQSAISRKDIKSISDVDATAWIEYHITYKDCSHISENLRKQLADELPGGETGAAYKSQFLAEFGSTDEMTVIKSTHVWKAKKVEKWIPEDHNTGGLDLSDGGDETVLAVRNGNKLLKLIPFRFDDTEDTVAFLDSCFKENGLASPNAYIYGDCGGLGKPILDRLRRMGYSNIRYRDNRAKTSRPKTYKNWGAESWFNFAKLLQNEEVILFDDKRLTAQLTSRYYKIVDGAIHQLLSKIEQRNRGYPSPDRADAVVLAFSDYKSTFVSPLDEKEKPFEVPKEETPTIKSSFTLQAHASGKQSGDMNKRWNVNGRQKNFDYLQDEIADLNRRILASK